MNCFIKLLYFIISLLLYRHNLGMFVFSCFIIIYNCLSIPNIFSILFILKKGILN